MVCFVDGGLIQTNLSMMGIEHVDARRRSKGRVSMYYHNLRCI